MNEINYNHNAETGYAELMDVSYNTPIQYVEVKKRKLKCSIMHKKHCVENYSNQKQFKKLYRCDKCKTVWFKFTSKFLK